MDLMNGIAAMSMEMSTAQFAQSYSLAVTKKAMDAEALALEEMTELLPASPAPARGAHIDTYA